MIYTIKWMNRSSQKRNERLQRRQNLRDSIGLQKQLNNMRYMTGMCLFPHNVLCLLNKCVCPTNVQYLHVFDISTYLCCRPSEQLIEDLTEQAKHQNNHNSHWKCMPLENPTHCYHLISTNCNVFAWDHYFHQNYFYRFNVSDQSNFSTTNACSRISSLARDNIKYTHAICWLPCHLRVYSIQGYSIVNNQTVKLRNIFIPHCQ